MEFNIISEFLFSDTLIRYIKGKEGAVGLMVIPASMAAEVAQHRPSMKGVEYENSDLEVSPWNVDSLVQLKCVGDHYPGGISQGLSMRNSGSVSGLKYDGQEVEQHTDCTLVKTRFEHPTGWKSQHLLKHYKGANSLEIQTIFENTTDEPLELEMIASFSLGFITPFDSADASEKLVLHQIRSFWSAEGRLESNYLEEKHIERSWVGFSAVCERFGQIGSSSVRSYFPFVAIEDVDKEITWGAQLCWSGSWQMEVYKKDDFVNISGGLADREFGHWLKQIQPGEFFKTPKAVLAVVKGGADELCQTLTSAHKRPLGNNPPVEKDLPIIFNEWCSTWGNPSHDNLIRIAEALTDLPVRYLVIDAGWYKTKDSPWGLSHGDWIPNRQLFPKGIKATAQAIRDRGLIPGIWYEMETVGEESTAFSLTNHLLKRDGVPLQSDTRRFWDFRDPFVHSYLKERLIDLIDDCGFGYLKIDYNETIGIGVDGAESLGEGLRAQMEGVYEFLDAVKRQLPELVIEMCSSGGHRLDPLMMANVSMASFSDAHETQEIPIIAANVHRMILPEQSQIWAVLRKNDDLRRLCYSLSATFLGRMCLSGDICDLNEQQLAIVKNAATLYRKTHHIVRDGVTHRFGSEILSYRHPKGCQAILRVLPDNSEAILIAHSFADCGDGYIEIPLPDSGLDVSEIFSTTGFSVIKKKQKLRLEFDGEFDSAVCYLNSN